MATDLNHLEREARFLEVNIAQLTKSLEKIGAVYEGDNLFSEIIYYDTDLAWKDEQKFVRLRGMGEKSLVTYKHNQAEGIQGTEEIEFSVDSFEQADIFLQRVGLAPYRHQEKRRITYQVGSVTADIDTWPGIPPYLELEGPDEVAIREVAEKLGFDWAEANLHNAAWVIENVYGVPVKSYRYFTFSKVG